MRKSSSPLLFTGTMLAATGYGATFLLSSYYRSHGGSDVDTGLTLGAAMIGTLAGVSLVGWFSGRIDAARMAAMAACAIACGFFILALSSGDGTVFTRASGLLIGLGWGMFYIGAPMALSERVTDADRGFWFTRFGAFQMAGIGGGPVLLNFLVKQLGFSIEMTFILVGIAALVASSLLSVFGFREPIGERSYAIRPWVRDIGRIASGPTIRPIVMVGLGACVFSGLMSFQVSLIEGTDANAGTYFVVYAVTAVMGRLLLARSFSRLKQSVLTISLLFVMGFGVAAMFGTVVHPLFQILSAILMGIGYGLVYPVIQTWAVNHTPPEHRHAALTWFVLSYFVGIFGFPVAGGWIQVHFGREALLGALLSAALMELAIALIPPPKVVLAPTGKPG
ncbi:MFS transporter [Nguyenibacter vanlangensis]|uniref:MFS transporter n=1 Tax=Nguyenibacter vanlangensis TaxID=1216886 RepID=A0ABZ3D236_9PROT